MAEAGLGVGDHLRLVGLGSARGQQVAHHVVDRVLEPAGGLDRRAPAQIDDALGQRRRPPGPRGPLGHQHLGATLPGGVRRTGAGRTEAGHEDIGLQVERADLGQREWPHSFARAHGTPRPLGRRVGHEPKSTKGACDASVAPRRR